MRTLVLLVSAFVLSACMSNPIPEGYNGPLAAIRDTDTPESHGGVDFFYVAKVNGKDVDNSLLDTIQANYGQGFQMTPMGYSREVPAEAGTFSIVGRTHYAAPIIELANKVYQVKGDVKFSPLPDHTYEVRGMFSEDYSAIWVEDTATGVIMDRKIEVHGPATLGFLEK